MINRFKTQYIMAKLLLGFAVLGVAACSETSGFQSSGVSKPNGTNPNGIGNNSIGDDAYINSDYFAQVGEIATQKFNLTSSVSKRVDIVWVIDNSSSMDLEAQIVRDNFSSFFQHLDGKTSLKLGLISTNVGKTGVNLPKTGPNFAHVIDRVESWDLMYMALLATCAKETNNFKNDILCGQEDRSLQGAFVSYNSPDPIVNGSLTNFFRPDAHRVYVFVTDDNAKGVKASNFLNLLRIANLKFTPTVFAFAALPSSAQCYTRIGTEYIDLARQTGGKAFDLCSKDWSQHYNDLTSTVETIANTEFLLRRRPSEILEVRIDNVPAAAGAYSLLGQKIRLNQGLVSPSSREFEVRYRVSK